ncbi:hypothetical protein [Micropruina sp.]|uniref:hypothetical protein n=1 Tax=Micropruina sp. TaxID=2737536 RepID=UPI0039E6CD0E
MVIDPLRGTWDEFAGLLRRAGATWWQFAPWLLGFALLGWVGHYGAVLLGTELTFWAPWLVILGLSIGAVAQLAAITIALRLVMERIGVGVGSVQQTPGEPPSAPLRLVAQTLLPFLAIYAAFGFVDDYARNVVLAMTGRYGLGSADFLSALNPTRSLESFALVVGIMAGLYLTRRGLDWLAGRSQRSWIGLVGAVIEASWLLVALFSVVRIVELLKLWLYGLELVAWWNRLQESLFGWMELAGVWLTVWEFVAAHAWPALWNVIAQPLAWLALAGVVAGIRVVTSAELLEQARGARAANLAKVANGFFAGDLDDKFVPLWQAVRFVARGGLPLLGGYVLAFTTIDLVGEVVGWGADQLIGPQYGRAAMQVMPFYDLIDLVLVMSLRLALLGVTVARVAERSGSEPPQHRIGEAITVFAVCLALALSSLAIRPDSGQWVKTGAVNTGLALFEAQVTVGEPRAGRELVDDRGVTRPTDLVFVVVPLTVAKQRGSVSVTPKLLAGSRSYSPWDEHSSLGTDPGFATAYDLVFEIDEADLAGELTLQLAPSAPLKLGELIGRVALPAPQVAAQVDYRKGQTQWVP